LGVALDGSKSYDPDGTIQLYRWDFGNGDYQDGPVIKRTFSSFGSYKIILTVTDDDGMTNSIGSTVTVNKADTAFVVSTTTPTPAPATNKAPVAIMSASPISGFAPMAVSFDASKSYDPDGKIVKYSWAFGKTSLGSGMVTSHTFTSAGSYIVTLYVTDDDGASTTATKTITVSDKRVLSHL
jgi:PKD repeat protein